MHIHPKLVHMDLKRAATIIGGPILPMPHSSASKTYRVEHVTITYYWNGSEWGIGNFASIALTGTVLKKDGSDSLNTARSHVHGEIPTWLQEIANELRPIGAPAWASAEFDVEA